MNAAVEVLNSQTRETQDSRRSAIFGNGTRFEQYMPPADEDTAVLATLEAMSAIARRTAADPVIVNATADAIGGHGLVLTRRQAAEAIWSYIRRHVTFVQDDQLWPGAREVLIEPPRLLTMPDPSGDCDDFTMLAGAMLLAAGVPVQFVVIAADQAEPERFSHVYALAVLESGELLPVDASHGPYAGWEAPTQFRRLPWTLMSPSIPAGPERPSNVLPYVVAAGIVLLVLWRNA